SPGDLALRIECYAVGGGITPGEPRFPRIGLVGVAGVGLGLGVFAAGHTADQPGAAAELLVQALEQPRHAVLGGPPPAAENAAVDARVRGRLHKASYRAPGRSDEESAMVARRRPSALRCRDVTMYKG